MPIRITTPTGSKFDFKKIPKIWNPATRLMITGVALFLILHSVSLSIVPSLFAGANLVYIGLAVAVTLLIRVLMALKWKLLFHYSGITLPLRYLLTIVLVNAFMGIFLPSSVGVDVIRTAAVGRRTGYTKATVSTLADRVMAILAMTLWSLVGGGTDRSRINCERQATHTLDHRRGLHRHPIDSGHVVVR